MEGLGSFFHGRRIKIRSAGNSACGRTSFRANTNCAKRPNDRPVETANSNILKERPCLCCPENRTRNYNRAVTAGWCSIVPSVDVRVNRTSNSRRPRRANPRNSDSRSRRRSDT